jgi:hypothetical protein
VTWLALLLAAALAAGDEPRVSILRVYPRMSVKPGSDIRVVVKVPRHPQNRSLVFNFDGDTGFGRDSVVQLDGDRAAMTHEFYMKAVPEGCYTVRAWIATGEGRLGKSYQAIEERAIVLGPNTTADGCF